MRFIDSAIFNRKITHIDFRQSTNGHWTKYRFTANLKVLMSSAKKLKDSIKYGFQRVLLQ